jgi:hypothetical protein
MGRLPLVSIRQAGTISAMTPTMNRTTTTSLLPPTALPNSLYQHWKNRKFTFPRASRLRRVPRVVGSKGV